MKSSAVTLDKDAEGYQEPDLYARRLNRMQHMFVDRRNFADMVPVLVEEGLLPEHEKHGSAHTVVRAGREVCQRCEHTVMAHWTRSMAKLKPAEVDFYQARWTWFASKNRLIDLCLRDYKGTHITRTTKRKQVVPTPGEFWPITYFDENGEEQTISVPAKDIAGVAFIVETIEREETVIHPKLLELASTIHNELARVAGLNIDEGDEDREPQETGQRRALLVFPPPERSGGSGGRGRTPVN